MICEIISIGEELLTGYTVNTNTAYISKKLREIGIEVLHQSVVGDHPARLSEQLKVALSRADIIVTTGGMGPTYDDLSKETVCEVIGKELVENTEIRNLIESFYTKLDREMPPSNLKQAMIPKDAVVIPNKKGTAPGLILTTDDGKKIIMFPGPPREVNPMMDDFVGDYLLKLTNKFSACRNLNIFGYGESDIFEHIKDYAVDSINPSIATYVGDFEVIVRIIAFAENEIEAVKLVDEAEAKLRTMLPTDSIYGVDSDGIEYALVEALTDKNMKIAVAESCTGGLISKRITDVAGASHVFDCGICSYGNNIKEKLLGVGDIDKHGAVSTQTAKAMAEGVLSLSSADIAIGITGIAGPGGGSEEKPVGLVYIAIATAQKTEVQEMKMPGINPSRKNVRKRASSNAMNLALKIVRKMK